MSKTINIPVQKNCTTLDEITIIGSVQDLVNNLTIENLALLAKKSQKPNINKRIQQYKNLI